MGCIFWLPSGVVNLREQESIFPLLGIALFVAGLTGRYVNGPVGFLLAFVVVYGLFTFTPGGYQFILVATAYAALYFIVATIYGSVVKYRTLVFNVLCVFALLNVLWIVLQSLGIHIFFIPKPGAETFESGFFANRNEVSLFLACTMPFFFRGKWHWGILAVLAGLVMAKTMNGLVGAALVLAVYGSVLLVRRGLSKQIAALLAALFAASCILAYGAFVHAGGYSSRVQAYWKALELIDHKPLLGWGLNQSRLVVPLYLSGDHMQPVDVARAYRQVLYDGEFRYTFLAQTARMNDGKKWTHLHNDYLQWAVETGFIGLGLLMLVIGSHAVVFFRTRGKDMLVGLSGLCLAWTACAFFTFQIGRFAFLAVMAMALIQGAYLKENGRVGR